MGASPSGQIAGGADGEPQGNGEAKRSRAGAAGKEPARKEPASKQGVSESAASSGAACSPVVFLERAAERLLPGDAAPDALTAVLKHLAACFGARAALALQCPAPGQLAVLGASPCQAAADPAILASVRTLHHQRRDAAAAGGIVRGMLAAPRSAADPSEGVLLALSAALPDGPPVLVALVGDPEGWDEETGSAACALASIIAARLRHSHDAATLAERSALSAALVRRAPDPIVASAADGRIVELNPAAEAFFGRRRDDVLGRQMTELMPPGERSRFERHADAYLREGDAGEYAGRMRVPVLRSDGTQLTAELTPVPMTIEGQVHFCGFLRDLTELEVAHAALADSEARFRLLAEVAPVGIMQTDLSGRIVFVNDRWCELTGLTGPDALGGSWTRALHPGDVERVEQERATAFALGTELHTDCRLRPSGDEDVWVNASVVALQDADGRPQGGLAAITNVSERKRQEQERARLLATESQARRNLADQTERLRSLIAAAIPGVLFADEQGAVTQLNQSFCALFDIDDDPGELTGTPVTGLVGRIKTVFAEPAEFVRRTSEALVRRQPAAGQQMACADGRTFECDYWPVLVDGEYRGDLWLAWDVSSQKAMEQQRERMLAAELTARELAELAREQLAEQNARLRELDDERTQFLATVSHELRTPLISIVSFVEMIRRDDQGVTPDTAESLDIVQRNAERLLAMVGELLLLSRIESGLMPLAVAPLSVPALVAQAAKSGTASAAQRGISIEVSAQDGPPVHGDELRLRQVFDNLISNAVKFSRRDGRVLITARYENLRWLIDVEDAGIGIPAGELGHVFDRFTRASNARTAGVPGTGLGLSVVKAITELHGGQVEVRSTAGSGTTFRVCLPLRS
ncbi:MAG: PAS domain S-box protein [Streptosporangiaceae bacterium]|jgi:PAS domain S-box-containing protein